MKKLILAILATATVASPMLATAAEAAPMQVRHTEAVRNNGNGRTVVTQRNVYRGNQQQHRSWQRGQRFDSRYAQNYRELDYRQYRGRHLYAPPRGYHWVQSGNDAVLVAVTGGIIGAVLAGAFN